jgi:hypothetical protein
MTFSRMTIRGTIIYTVTLKRMTISRIIISRISITEWK